MRNDCLFCGIADGDIPSTRVFEDEELVAFRDIDPKAPVHVVVIPRKHITSLNEFATEDAAYIASVISKLPVVAEAAGVKEDGYRVITNIGEDGGQSVKHLHFHILGGKKLSWENL